MMMKGSSNSQELSAAGLQNESVAAANMLRAPTEDAAKSRW